MDCLLAGDFQASQLPYSTQWPGIDHRVATEQHGAFGRRKIFSQRLLNKDVGLYGHPDRRTDYIGYRETEQRQSEVVILVMTVIQGLTVVCLLTANIISMIHPINYRPISCLANGRNPNALNDSRFCVIQF